MRPFNEFLKGYFGNKELVGIEIGVQGGENSKGYLDNLNIKKLYLIDPYEKWTESRILGSPKTSDSSKYWELAHNELEPYKEKVEFIRLKSDDAIDKVPDRIDFVYIDGNHTYEYANNDIINYSKKVISDGVVGGDDYGLKWNGVTRSVNEYVDREQLELTTAEYETRVHPRKGSKRIQYEWWVIKK